MGVSVRVLGAYDRVLLGWSLTVSRGVSERGYFNGILTIELKCAFWVSGCSLMWCVQVGVSREIMGNCTFVALQYNL